MVLVNDREHYTTMIMMTFIGATFSTMLIAIVAGEL